MSRRQPEPIWYHRVPHGFWGRPENRRAFFEWLERKLRIRKPEDWYQFTGATVRRLGGTTVLRYYDDSAMEMVREFVPWYDWKEWLFPIVPAGFWDDAANRIRYLEWLGNKLGFKKPEDWYQLSNRDLRRNRGNTLLERYPNPYQLMKAHFPEHEWHEWCFRRTPDKFWDDPAKVRRYLDWLGKELGYKKMEDWYRLTFKDLAPNRGQTLVARFRSSPPRLVMHYFPEYPWQEWKFLYPPEDFWDDPKGCRRYLAWLGEQLGYERMEDWYQIKYRDFVRHRGVALTNRYRDSPSLVLKTFMPEYDWHEWLFDQTPKRFWSERRNRRRYLEWLAEKLGIREPEDWGRLRLEHFRENHGRSLLVDYNHSIAGALLDTFPARHPAVKGFLATRIVRKKHRKRK